MQVREDGVPQQIESLELVERPNAPDATASPVSLALVFDRLGPSARRFARGAALELLARELAPGTAVGVFSIDRRLAVLQPFTEDREARRSSPKVSQSRPTRRACAWRAPRTRCGGPPTPSGRALRPSSDGGRVTDDSPLALLVRNEDTLRVSPEGSMARLAEETGGFSIRGTNDLSAGLAQVEEELRSHYVLSYTPKNRDFDGRFRTIVVKVGRPHGRLQARKATSR